MQKSQEKMQNNYMLISYLDKKLLQFEVFQLNVILRNNLRLYGGVSFIVLRGF